jgi:hypothetical protein
MKTGIASVIDLKFNNFQERFLALDPFRTGFVMTIEFTSILKEICDELDEKDLEEISLCYDTNHDDR